MFSDLRSLLKAIPLAITFLLLCPAQSLAQGNMSLVTTNDPETYVSDLLIGIETDGMSTMRDLFNSMGLTILRTKLPSQSMKYTRTQKISPGQK